MKCAIYGAGAMGTVLGAYIAKAGREIDLVNRNEKHVAALREKGAHIIGKADFVQKVNALLPSEMTEKYDVILLMTKQRDNPHIVAFLKDHLKEDGALCTCQNGLPEPAVAEIIGEDRTLGCAIAWGATFHGEGVSELTSDPSALTFSLGAIGRGNHLQDVKELVSLLRRCSNNLNQYAKRANEAGSIYQEDIRDLQARLDEIWQCARELLSRLASIR